MIVAETRSISITSSNYNPLHSIEHFRITLTALGSTLMAIWLEMMMRKEWVEDESLQDWGGEISDPSAILVSQHLSRQKRKTKGI